jgi:hypothetical protein
MVCLLLAAAIVLAIAFVSRQRTLEEMRVANRLLQQQVDASAALPDARPAAESPSANPVADLSPQEKIELLRLRGQIQPLRSELAGLSNRLSRLTRSESPATLGSPAAVAPGR